MDMRRHAWLVSLVLAACASSAPQWEKPGATAASMQEDSDQCRSLAILSPMPQHYAPPPSGAATVSSAITMRQEQLAAHESEQFQKCMTDKGYRIKR
jgi:uncharacterized protein with von Willebrand factor type A (vWA) domain